MDWSDGTVCYAHESAKSIIIPSNENSSASKQNPPVVKGRELGGLKRKTVATTKIAAANPKISPLFTQPRSSWSFGY